MQQTNLFFSPVVDLKHHALPEPAKHALEILYLVGKTVNQPAKFGAAIETILIDAVHQDYDSPLHRVWLPFDVLFAASLTFRSSGLLASDYGSYYYQHESGCPK